jgi:hypothetical protein
MCSWKLEINRTVTQHGSDGVGAVITLHCLQIDFIEVLSELPSGKKNSQLSSMRVFHFPGVDYVCSYASPGRTGSKVSILQLPSC